jgi:hypothetical protein
MRSRRIDEEGRVSSRVSCVPRAESVLNPFYGPQLSGGRQPQQYMG